MKLTARGLVEYVKDIEKKQTVYMWGSFGQLVTDIFIQQKKRQYPEWYTTVRVNKFKSMVNKSTYAFDCVGLIKSYMWGGVDNLKYDLSQDKSADGMYSVAKVKGGISTLNKQKIGQIVWMSGHVGVHIGNGEVIEATPAFSDGVVKTRLEQRKWIAWFECPYIEYEEVKEEVVQSEERYNTIEELPTWGKETVEKLLAKGYLNGTESGLDLSKEMLRILVITDRAGVYNK